MQSPLLIGALACALAAPAGANAAELKLRALLRAGNVVSATQSPATGEARARLGDDNGLRLDLVYSGLEERATGAALHLGKPGEDGALVERVALEIDEGDGRVLGAQLDVSVEVGARLRAGEGYVVIRTIEHPDGVIRGQLVPEPVRLRAAPLSKE